MAYNLYRVCFLQSDCESIKIFEENLSGTKFGMKNETY